MPSPARGNSTRSFRTPPSEGGGDEVASATFEWTLDGRFLCNGTTRRVPRRQPRRRQLRSPHHTYTQHYFDPRGVVRVYVMTFDGQAWTLLRDAADFSPLDFSQRFVGTFSHAATASGGWEISEDGVHWEHDFDLTYSKVTGWRPPARSARRSLRPRVEYPEGRACIIQQPVPEPGREAARPGPHGAHAVEPRGGHIPYSSPLSTRRRGLGSNWSRPPQATASGNGDERCPSRATRRRAIRACCTSP